MMSPRPLRSALLALALLLSLSGAALPVLAQSTPVATPAAAAVHGIDVANMDLSVSPRVDFYRFANGGWLDRTVIPPDRPATNVLSQLADRTIAQQLALLRGAAGPDGAEPGSDEAKAAAIFIQGMDMAARDQQGIAPIQDALDRIAAIDSLSAYHDFQQIAIFDGIEATLSLWVLPDLKESTRHALYLGGPSLGLPNRDYYLDDDPSLEIVREAYLETSAEFLIAAGYEPEAAAAAAQAVYDFERSLAAETLTREQQQDFSLQYTPMSLDELSAAYPEMNWPAYLEALGVSGVERVIVGDAGYLAALPTIMAETPLETLRAYLTRELVASWANVLSTDLVQTSFSFEQVLTGLEEQPPLDERVLNEVNAALPDAVGRLYVAAHFPPEAKMAIEALTADVLDAFGERLEANTWMTPETRTKALEKLDAVAVKVGYPDRWDTYEAVEVADSFAGALQNALGVDLRKQFSKAGQPVDRTEWDLPAQIVNAQYNPLANEIVFPAGILQPPFFDHEADPASNYGAIGFAIGHEITHGFDLMGSQFDAQGNFADWWTTEDLDQFLALNEALAEQYSAIEVAPGLFVDGQIAVTENAADLGGVQNAFAALQARLAEDRDAAAATPVSGISEVGVTPPFSPDQRFFIAAASVWRNKTRPAFLELLVRTDTHAPGSVRATQPLRNMAPFFAAFDIEAGDPMWLPPDERIVIW